MKNKIALVLIFAFVVFVSFYYGAWVKKSTLSLNDFVISNLYDFKDFLEEVINKHFNQAEKIALLEAKNKELERSSILLATFANELNRLLEDQNSSKFLPEVKRARAISFVQANEYTKVWLEDIRANKNKNKGLIYNGFSAGILVENNGRAMGLLQTDDKSAFSVFVGAAKAPGVAQGKSGKLMVNFIPKLALIKPGDEVITSGLDGVFFGGVGVGVVEKVIEDDMYQSAQIKPFIELEIPAYLYVVERL